MAKDELKPRASTMMIVARHGDNPNWSEFRQKALAEIATWRRRSEVALSLGRIVAGDFSDADFKQLLISLRGPGCPALLDDIADFAAHPEGRNRSNGPLTEHLSLMALQFRHQAIGSDPQGAPPVTYTRGDLKVLRKALTTRGSLKVVDQMFVPDGGGFALKQSPSEVRSLLQENPRCPFVDEKVILDEIAQAASAVLGIGAKTILLAIEARRSKMFMSLLALLAGANHAGTVADAVFLRLGKGTSGVFVEAAVTVGDLCLLAPVIETGVPNDMLELASFNWAGPGELYASLNTDAGQRLIPAYRLMQLEIFGIEVAAQEVHYPSAGAFARSSPEKSTTSGTEPAADHGPP